MKNYIPFSNGTEAMMWLENNCESCTTKCYYKSNFEKGFITGNITLKTAEHVGIIELNGEYVRLENTCKNKDKIKKKLVRKSKHDDNLKLF